MGQRLPSRIQASAEGWCCLRGGWKGRKLERNLRCTGGGGPSPESERIDDEAAPRQKEINCILLSWMSGPVCPETELGSRAVTVLIAIPAEIGIGDMGGAGDLGNYLKAFFPLWEKSSWRWFWCV